MKIKSLGRYLLPILGLIILNFIYFYPAIQGKILEQDDIMLGYAKGKEIRDYREKHDEEPLWTQAMFSGMPTFQISTQYPNNWLTVFQKTISFIGGNASGIYIIFSLMFGFYLLMIAMKVNPWLGAIGAVAFAFSAFFIISFGAGHNAKVRAAAYIAPVVMGVLLCYRGKYLAGLALTALFVGLAVHANHFQITYYLLIILLCIAVVEFIFAFKEKHLARFWKASGLLVIAAIIGIGPNISNLWSTYEYTRETMRGGGSELSAKAESQGGLSYDYAMNWSYGISETFNLVFADFSGGGSAQTYEGTQFHETYFNRYVQGMASQGASRATAEKQVNQYMGSIFYWGDQSLVNGGYYIGAVVFFLFVLGLFIVRDRIKWWVVAVCILSLFMAWGKNFSAFNEFLYYNLPLYNKFRVPSYTFTMAFFAVPFLGFLAAGRIFSGNYNKDLFSKHLKYSLYITGGLSLLFILFAGSLFDFVGPRDAELTKQGLDIGMLEEDRLSLLRQSATKTLIFCALTFGLFWLWAANKVKAPLFLVSLLMLVIIDQWPFVKQHVNADDFVTERAYENMFAPTQADLTILQDKDPHFRVFNTTAGLTSDSYTSYYHHSIGGYHGAKLIRYQDLIENQLGRQNLSCFNMLNTKYFIVGSEDGSRKMAQQNPQACGNAWFVNNIQWVENADAEMAALSDFNPKETVIIDERFKDQIPADIPDDNSSSIRLKEFGLKKLVYEADVKSESQFAVFSEIYYQGGNNDWKTYIDGEKANHIRVNYLLRGMSIPKGKHTITFEFHPRSYYMGESISLVFSILLILVLAGSVFIWYRNNNSSEETSV